MKAYEIHPNEGFASLTKVERPAPSALGPLDVRVRVHAMSLDFRDLAIAKSAETFAFDDARAAYEHLDSGAHFGNVVITI